MADVGACFLEPGRHICIARQISQFFQEEGKIIKRGENHHKSGHVENCSYSKGEVSQFRESEEGKCCDVIYATGVVVFIITYFHKLMHQPNDNKQRLSSHEKSTFKLRNIVCNSGHNSDRIKK